MRFLVNDWLAVEIIFGNYLLNRHVTGIRCAEKKVQLCKEVITIGKKRHGLTAQGKKPSDWKEAHTKTFTKVGSKPEKVQKEEKSLTKM